MGNLTERDGEEKMKRLQDLIAFAMSAALVSLANPSAAAPKPVAKVAGQFVFLTSNTYTGNLVGEATALGLGTFATGNLAGDAICQHHATQAGLPGIYHALLTPFQGQEHEFPLRDGPFFRPGRNGGVMVAESRLELFQGMTIVAPIAAFEDGTYLLNAAWGDGFQDGGANVWTGVQSGVFDVELGPSTIRLRNTFFSSFHTCTGWTTNDSHDAGYVGSPIETRSFWRTVRTATCGPDSAVCRCDNPRLHIYCVGE